MSFYCPTIRQLLSEEQIIVGPDGRPVVYHIFITLQIRELLFPPTLILIVRNGTISKAEVTVFEAILYVLQHVGHLIFLIGITR